MSTQNTTSHQRLQAAVADHTAGRVRAAASVYQELLSADPRNADLMQRLGVALAQLGDREAAVHMLAGSLEVQPRQPSVLLNLARALYELGRHADALKCCDEALRQQGNLASVYRLRSTILTALGRHEDALTSAGQALRLAIADAGAHADYGVALAAVGRKQDALESFDRAIALDPTLVNVHHNYGLLAAQLGLHERALRSLDRELELQPMSAAAYANRGNVLKELGRLAEAVRSYTVALTIEPTDLASVHNRAVVQSLLGRHADALQDYNALVARNPGSAPDLIGRGSALVALHCDAEALEPLQSAIALLPEDPDAHIQLGVALLRLDRNDEAVASFDRALALRPDLPEVLNNRGIALAAIGRLDEALQSLKRSLVLNGAAVDVHTNAGVVRKALGRHDEAFVNFGQALALRPGDPAAEFELGFMHLSLAEFGKGWPLYESRFAVPALGIPPRQFSVPRWNGSETIAGKTLLVHAEQGLGDAIQFCRYLPLLAGRGVSVVFEVMPSLQALMRSLAGDIHVVARGETLPHFDFHCPLLSLPLAFKTDLASIPASIPYLHAAPDRLAEFARQFNGLPGQKIGIAWQGNPKVERLIWARGRSMPLVALEPLARVPGVTLVSLQKGAGSEQLATAPFNDRVFDFGPEFDNGADAFLDTAAVISKLDLVISTDTAIVHLAGALGRPVWTLLNATPDWRWMLNREDSPWYPTMRLFRATTSGWPDVVSAVVAALKIH